MKRTLSPILVLALAACGGGSTSAPGIPHAQSSPPPAPADASFRVVIPAGVVASARTRRPFDFSAGTRSVTIALGGTTLKTADVSSSSSLCTPSSGGGRTCTIGVEAPVGSETFTLTAFDQPNGTGNVLATGTVTATVSSSASQPIDVAVAGTATKLRVSLQNAYPPAGTSATSAVAVTAIDADGNTVLGGYAKPISLADSDRSGATALSSTQLASSSASATLSYNGATPFTSATITATASGLAPASASFAVTPAFAGAYTVPPISNGRFTNHAGVGEIAYGPDGNMWIAGTAYAEIIKVTAQGTISTYPLDDPGYYPQGMAAGSDGNLWFAENQNNAIGKITPSGSITEYTLPGDVAGPDAVALGKDKNIWFVDQFQDVVGSITPSGTVTEYPLPNQQTANPIGIASGPDGNLWITDAGNNTIVAVTTSGKIAGSYPIPTPKSGPWGITQGPDGNVWFAESNANRIARVTPAGAISEFLIPTGSAIPDGVAAGPDGNVWFAELGNEVGQGKIGYVTPDGKTIRDFPDPAGLHDRNLTFDAHGKLWVTSFAIEAVDEVQTVVY